MPVFNWLQMGLGAFAAFSLSYLVATVNDYRIDAQWREKLSAQVAADNKQCSDDKAKTKEANDALQKGRDSIALKLANAKRMQPTRCLLPTTGKAIVPGVSGEHAGQNGIDTDTLRDYAAQCETIRQSYGVCVDYWQ